MPWNGMLLSVVGVYLASQLEGELICDHIIINDMGIR